MGTKGEVICTALGVGFLDVITALDGRELVASDWYPSDQVHIKLVVGLSLGV